MRRPGPPEAGAPASDWRSGVRATYRRVPPLVRQVVIAALGAAVLLAGAVMLVLPGPGLLTIAAGLAILALEFPWARRTLAGLRARAAGAAQRVGRSGPNRPRE